jgi:hypothetical protein
MSIKGMAILVDIATTDTSLCNMDNHIMGIFKLWLGAIFNDNVLDGP